jgi:hypothetical protein
MHNNVHPNLSPTHFSTAVLNLRLPHAANFVGLLIPRHHLCILAGQFVPQTPDLRVVDQRRHRIRIVFALRQMVVEQIVGCTVGQITVVGIKFGNANVGAERETTLAAATTRRDHVCLEKHAVVGVTKGIIQFGRRRASVTGVRTGHGKEVMVVGWTEIGQ